MRDMNAGLDQYIKDPREVYTYLNLPGLRCYHDQLMKHINALVVNRAFEYTNCPNCGAIITEDECKFCGTIFKKKNEE